MLGSRHGLSQSDVVLGGFCTVSQEEEVSFLLVLTLIEGMSHVVSGVNERSLWTLEVHGFGWGARTGNGMR